MSSIDVAVMNDATVATRPFSYPQATQSTRAASREAVRASHRGERFVLFAVLRAKPDGFVFQTRANGRPTGIIDRFSHAGFGKFRAGDVAHDNEVGTPRNLCGDLMRPVFAPILELGMDRLRALFLSGTLGHRKFISILTRQVFPAVCFAIGAGNLVFKPKINTDGVKSERLLRFVRDLALKVDVPTTSGVLCKASALNGADDGAGEPEAKRIAAVGDAIISNTDATAFKRYPA